MEFLGLTPWEWILPIMIGVVAGLATNAVAIWMLFHPYEAVHLGPLRILPKGAIPKEIDRVARRIGETVGTQLLTPDDITRTVSSPAFRDRFDATLRDALQGLLDRELGSLREVMSEDQAAGIEEVLVVISGKLREGIALYLASEELEGRVRGMSEALITDFRDRPLSTVITDEMQEDVVEGARELWAGVRESPELRRSIDDALRGPLERLLVSEKPLRHYVPARAVNLGEAFVSRYLPILLERLGEMLGEEETREKIQGTLRRMVDRLLEEQQAWKRLVGRLVVTERTLAQTVRAIEEGGVDEIAALLREPEVQHRIAASINEGVEELLARPVRELIGEVSPERSARIRGMVVDRILYMIRHPNAEEILVGRLEGLVRHGREKTLGGLVDLLGTERAHELSDRLADWLLSALRGPRASRFLDQVVERRTSYLLTVPIGRVGQYLPPDAARRAEGLLFDPLWDFIQSRVPAAVAELPVAAMVEEKIKAFPISQVEELIWRVSRNELVLIVYLGGFLGALIGSAMLFTLSPPAGAVAVGFFLLVSFVFVNVKGREAPPHAG